MNSKFNFIVAIAIFLLLPMSSRAQVTATGIDNSSNYGGSYSTGSNQGTDNNPALGTGYQAFTVTPTPNGGFAGTFISSSGTSIDTGGNSFGMYANNGTAPQVAVNRLFAAPLQAAGDSFSIDLRSDFFVHHNDSVFSYTIGPETLKYNDPTATGSSFAYSLSGGNVGASTVTLTPSDYILHALFQLTSPTTYNFSVTSYVSGDTATDTGVVPGGGVTGFTVGMVDASNQYFNNLQVSNVNQPVPEPNGTLTLAIGMLVLGGLAIRHRRFMVS